MDPISLLRQVRVPTTLARDEGRVESIDAKKGTVSVRLSSGELVQAAGDGLSEGDQVVLQKGSEGGLVARPVGNGRSTGGDVASLPSSLRTLAGAEALAQALRAGEPATVRAALESIARELDGAAASSPDLAPARTRGFPPLAALGGDVGATRGAAVPLVLVAAPATGVYQAEAAGRGVVLQGVPGLPVGSAGLWMEHVVEAGASVWMPVDLDASEPPELPARLPADDTGARRLLDRLGVEAPDPSDPSFRSLVRTLVRAAALAAAPGEGRGAPSEPRSPEADAAPSESRAGSTPAAGGADGATEIDVDLVALPRRENPPGATTSRDPQGLRPEVGAPGRETTEGPAGAPAGEVRAASVPEPVPVRAASDSAEDGASAVAARRSLGAVAALRVAAAWSLSQGEPSDEILAAAVGDALDLPEVVHRLAARVAQVPDAFPEVAAFLARADPASPVMPHRIGLEKGRPRNEEDVRTLAHAVSGDLARALATGRSEDAQALREALRGLVGEGLDAAKDPSNPMAATPWTMPPRGERPDAGRIVVRDRRSRREGSPEKTVVEVAMSPTGLGAVGARLEAVGRELDVRFRAAEPGTAERIREALPELRDILEGLGYGTRGIGVEGGRVSVPLSEPKRPGSAGLLDLRA